MLYKLLPLLVGLLLTFLVPKVLQKRTHELSIEEALIREQDFASHDTLDYLLTWRDTINNVILGIFVLLFTISEDVTSRNAIIATIAQVTVFGLIPMMIIVTW